jgi:hypothetical protein
MRSLVLVLVLLPAAVAWGDDAKVTSTGKVVSVEADGSLWVYFPDLCTSYHLVLSGVATPAADQPQAKTVRNSLAQMVLGREVSVRVARLNTVGPTPGEVILQGRSVNTELAGLIGGAAKPESPNQQTPPRRPLLTFIGQIRARLPWRN